MSSDTIAVAMSGGVDSSTVAAMLRADGHNVIGLTMQLWNQRRLSGREGMPESVQGRCCSLDDVYDARRVAQQIGIRPGRQHGDRGATMKLADRCRRPHRLHDIAERTELDNQNFCRGRQPTPIPPALCRCGRSHCP